MNNIEHLLICLNEECAEVIQAIDKSLRFGLGDGYPDSGRTNIQDIINEINDVFAVIELLQEENFSFLVGMLDEEHIEKKKRKVLEYMDYAREKKTLE